MKTLSLLALLMLGMTGLASADNIVIFKRVDSFKGTTYYEANPGATPTGFAPISLSGSATLYDVINLTTQRFVEIVYSVAPAPSNAKTMVIYDEDDLSVILDPRQPVKGTTLSYLWSFQRGSLQNSSQDLDGDLTDDYFNTSIKSSFYNGRTSPFVVSRTLTIPDVARSLSGKVVQSSWRQSNVVQPYRSFTRYGITVSFTLDTSMSTLANTTAIAGTTDLAPNTVDLKAAATLANGVQRVRNALYALGYRIPPP